MGRKLTQITWSQLQKEMSIAGDPEKIVEIGKDVEALITPRINVHNLAEVINVQIVLQKILAEFKLWERIERQRQHPKK